MSLVPPELVSTFAAASMASAPPGRDDPPAREHRSRRRWFTSPRELWAWRELAHALFVRNLRVKYGRSALGFVWTLANPALTLLVLIAVFGQVVRMPVPGYWAFLLSGYFAWSLLSQMLSSATYVLPQHAALRRASGFPLEIPVLAALAARLVEFAVELLLVLVLLAVWHHGGVPEGFAVAPLLVVLLACLALGLSLPLAALAARFHDVQHALPAILTLLFYASPVFWSVRLLPPELVPLATWNPIAPVLTVFQVALHEGRIPPAALLGTASAVSVGVAILGYVLFGRQQSTLVELL